MNKRMKKKHRYDKYNTTRVKVPMSYRRWMHRVFCLRRRFNSDLERMMYKHYMRLMYLFHQCISEVEVERKYLLRMKKTYIEEILEQDLRNMGVGIYK